MTLEEAWRASNERNKCEKNRFKLCKFEITYDDGTTIGECCDFCGKRIHYNIVDGRIDNVRYLADHIRNFLQPTGRTRNLFYEIYGNDPVKRMEAFKKAKEKGRLDQDDMLAYARDTYKTVKSMHNSGKEIT